MENIYLKFPELSDKEKWSDYLKEYLQDDPNATPLGYKNDTIYEEWLKQRTNEHLEKNLKKYRVPASVYFLKSDDKIIGHVSIRHNLNNYYLAQFGGHIGYGIRPSERRKGYATKLLRLALTECDKLGLKEVMVTCKEDNIASAKTIENNYGVLKDKVFVSTEDCNFKIYWIKVQESLNKKL